VHRLGDLRTASPAGGRVTTAPRDGTVRLWDATPTGKGVRALDFRPVGKPRCVAFSPEGRHVVVGLGNGVIAIARVAP
jgi:WD40 repeat protein